MTIKEVSEKYDISADTLRYYERIGMIPEVTRNANGIRNYQKSDLGWVELAICMRSAGLPVEALIEYVKLFQKGDSTFAARLQLLQEQREKLEEQKAQLQTAMLILIKRWKTERQNGKKNMSRARVNAEN